MSSWVSWSRVGSTLNRCESPDPSYVGLYYHLGKLLERLERIEEAVSVYRDGIGIATRLKDLHARSELQSALLEAEMGEW